MTFEKWCKVKGIKFSRRKYERPARKVWVKSQADIDKKNSEISELLDELESVSDLLEEIKEQLKGD